MPRPNSSCGVFRRGQTSRRIVLPAYAGLPQRTTLKTTTPPHGRSTNAMEKLFASLSLSLSRCTHSHAFTVVGAIALKLQANVQRGRIFMNMKSSPFFAWPGLRRHHRSFPLSRGRARALAHRLFITILWDPAGTPWPQPNPASPKFFCVPPPSFFQGASLVVRKQSTVCVCVCKI